MKKESLNIIRTFRRTFRLILFSALLLLSLLIIYISTICILYYRPVCNNTNPIFDNYQPVAKEYKLELIKQLSVANKSKLKYWFIKYTEFENEEHLHFYIQSKELCAVIVLNVEQSDKLKQLRKVKGRSYQGSRFTNLQFDIEQDTLNIKFVYKNHSRILD